MRHNLQGRPLLGIKGGLPSGISNSRIITNPHSNENAMKITMKNAGKFTSAVSKHVYIHSAGETLDVDAKDIVHLDKNDYTVGEAKKPEEKKS